MGGRGVSLKIAFSRLKNEKMRWIKGRKRRGRGGWWVGVSKVVIDSGISLELICYICLSLYIYLFYRLGLI